MRLGTFLAADGEALPTRTWEPGATPVGTVVFTHGYLLDSRCWQPVIPWVSRAGWRAVAWDVRGHGRARTLAPHTIEQAAEDLARLAASVEGPLALVGHSMGAMIVQQALPRLAQRVCAVGLLATTAGGDGAVPLEHARWGSAVYRHGRALGRVWPVAARFANGRYSVSPAAVAGYLPAVRGFTGPPAAFTGPVLLVGAGRDRLIPAAAFTGLRATYPDAQVLELPDAAHEVMRVAPTRVGRAVADLLRRAV